MAGEKFFVREFERRLTEIVLESARMARFSDMPKKRDGMRRSFTGTRRCFA